MYDFKERLAKIYKLNEEKSNRIMELKYFQEEVGSTSRILKSIENKIDELKDQIRDELLADGNLSQQQDGVTYKLRKLPNKMEVLCKPEELPKEYQRVKIEADKKKLKADFKDGKLFNYCKQSEDEYVLDIVHG